MKRFVLLFLISLGPALLSGLIGCSLCSGDKPTQYRIAGYKIQLLKSPVLLTNSGPLQPVAVGDTLNFRQVMLILSGEATYVAKQSLGGASAFACSPAVEPRDTIRKMRITSNQSYSTDLPAGSDLTPVLAIGSSRYSTLHLSDYLKGAGYKALDRYELSLLKAPDKAAMHQLVVTVELDNGKIFSDTTAAVVIKP